MKNVNTQAYLDVAQDQKAKNPAAQLAQALESTLRIGAIAQDVMVMHAHAALAEATEIDPEVRSRLDECSQRLRALLRAHADMQGAMKVLSDALFRWHELDSELRNLAKDRGYGV